MTATHLLMREHQTILRVLACLETLVTQPERPEANADTFRRIVDFLRTYADRLHHGKEEDLLFPMLEADWRAPYNGPTTWMRREHDRGRALVGRMALACKKDGKRDEAEALAAFRPPALDFVALLRAHIAKEDFILFPMADQMLDAETARALDAAYAEAEAGDFDPGIHDRYESWARELARGLGILDERFHVTPACHG